jgi:hypothetical protein
VPSRASNHCRAARSACRRLPFARIYQLAHSLAGVKIALVRMDEWLPWCSLRRSPGCTSRPGMLVCRGLSTWPAYIKI